MREQDNRAYSVRELWHALTIWGGLRLRVHRLTISRPVNQLTFPVSCHVHGRRAHLASFEGARLERIKYETVDLKEVTSELCHQLRRILHTRG